MKALYVIIMIAATMLTKGAIADEWTGQDKTGHATHSMAFGIASSILVNEPTNWSWKASALCMIPGLGKEFHDSWSKEGSGFSYKDLVADAVGCAAGIALTQQAVIYIYHRNNTTSVVASFKF